MCAILLFIIKMVLLKKTPALPEALFIIKIYLLIYFLKLNCIYIYISNTTNKSVINKYIINISKQIVSYS